MCLCAGGLHRPPEGAGQREDGGLEGQDGGEAGKEVRARLKQEDEEVLQLSRLCVCRVVELTGDVSPDMRAMAQADLIVTTPEKWDGVSRSWQNRSYVQKVSILIIDEIHLLGKAARGRAWGLRSCWRLRLTLLLPGEDRGPVLEVIVSRTNFISSHTSRTVRVVGLSTALANARDLADWLGIKQVCLCVCV